MNLIPRLAALRRPAGRVVSRPDRIRAQAPAPAPAPGSARAAAPAAPALPSTEEVLKRFRGALGGEAAIKKTDRRAR